MLGLEELTCLPSFQAGPGNPNSSPHAFTATDLSIGPAPQLPYFMISTKTPTYLLDYEYASGEE